MREILIVTTGAGDDALELAAAARALGEVRVTAAVCGAGTATAAAELARWCEEVVRFDDPSLAVFDGDLLAQVLAPWIAVRRLFATLLAHDNDGFELAPALAARLDSPLIGDCLALEVREERLSAVRAVYGGKVHARVVAAPAAAGCVASLRPGAFAVPAVPPECGGAITSAPLPPGVAPRRRLLETLAPEAGEVDITQAEVLVAVGRGIEEEENLALVRSLAAAMGAELACTRPIVDKGWLAKSRQVGTSGRTVKPKVYLAIGVSGSFQHLGGLKGGPYLAAINKDPAAPIFAAADVGIVGDLFDLVPLLERKIREREE